MSDAGTPADWQPPSDYLPAEGSGADLSTIGAADRTAQSQLPWTAYAQDKGSDFITGAFKALSDAVNTNEDEYNTRLDQQFGVTPQQDSYNAPIDPTEWQKKYPDLGVTFTPDMSAPVAQILVDNAQQDARRNYIVAHSPQDLISRTGRFALDAGIALTDPLNVAAAFVPGVGEARAGLWAERFGPTIARLAEGGTAGATGTMALQPLEYEEAKTYQQQYGPMDAFLNVAFGTALGGGLHALVVGPIADYLGRLAPETREMALRGSVAQSLEGRDVNVDPILAADPANLSEPAPVPSVPETPPAPVQGPTPDDVNAALADVQYARGGVPQEAKSPSLFKAIRDMGGLKLKDEAGNAHDPGDFKSILQNAPNFGLIDNKRGSYPDNVRQSLEERGWFGNRENNSSTIGDLGDLLDREARAPSPAEKVYHPESTTVAHMRSQARDLDEADVRSSDSDQVAAQKLAQYRHDTLAEHFNRLRAGADEMGVPHDADTTHEQLLADMIERDGAADPTASDEAMTDAQEAQLNEYLAARFGRTTDERTINDRGQAEGFGSKTREAEGNASGGQRGEGQDRAGAYDPGARIGRRTPQEVIGAAREKATAFAQGKEASAVEAAPSVRASVANDVRAHLGDDPNVELQDALELVRKYHLQGIVSDKEAQALLDAGKVDSAAAQTQSDAARAAAHCLYLHP